MNEVTTFTAPAGMNVRVITIDGNPWFVAKDVCAALDLVKTDRAIAPLQPDERTTTILSTLGGAQRMTVISESGLYRIILRAQPSNPAAAQFQDWVTREVLPSIRKHGGYIAGQEQMSDTELLAKALKVSERISAEKSARIIELEDETKVLHFGGEMLTIRDYCKETGIGLDLDQRRRLGMECAAYTRVSGQEAAHQAVAVKTAFGSVGSQVRVFPEETINHCLMVLGLSAGKNTLQ
jgi:prophage antirepressor-like protein